MTSSNETTPVTVRTVEANGMTVNVATAGRGPAILLLHGWPHTWQVWGSVIPLLALHYHVIAPDLRGIGGTTRATSGYDLETLADDATALLDALQVVKRHQKPIRWRHQEPIHPPATLRSRPEPAWVSL